MVTTDIIISVTYIVIKRHILKHHIPNSESFILAIFYPPLKYIWGCVGLILQTWKGNIYFTELAERVEYGNCESLNAQRAICNALEGSPPHPASKL